MKEGRKEGGKKEGKKKKKEEKKVLFTAVDYRQLVADDARPPRRRHWA
jgi:hypothetical protein